MIGSGLLKPRYWRSYRCLPTPEPYPGTAKSLPHRLRIKVVEELNADHQIGSTVHCDSWTNRAVR